jgi:hypothetical protein
VGALRGLRLTEFFKSTFFVEWGVGLIMDHFLYSIMTEHKLTIRLFYVD